MMEHNFAPSHSLGNGPIKEIGPTADGLVQDVFCHRGWGS